MKKIFYFAALLLGFSACKQEVNQPTTLSNATDNYSKTVLNGDTTIHKLLINDKYTYVNEVKGVYYYADDLILSSEQFNTLLKMANADLSTTERSTILSSFTRTWPNNTIYYALPVRGSLNATNYAMFIANIQEAIKLITAQTSVIFVERTTQSAYVQFVAGQGNSSPLGYRANTVNTVTMYNYNIPAIIAHELMHSMGIHHEQTRPDRDNFIIVNFNRIQPGAQANFNIDPAFKGNGAFDFNSVMLYASVDFAINPNQPVMTRLDGSTFTKQRVNLSAGDYAGINALYPAIN